MLTLEELGYVGECFINLYRSYFDLVTDRQKIIITDYINGLMEKITLYQFFTEVSLVEVISSVYSNHAITTNILTLTDQCLFYFSTPSKNNPNQRIFGGLIDTIVYSATTGRCNNETTLIENTLLPEVIMNSLLISKEAVKNYLEANPWLVIVYLTILYSNKILDIKLQDNHDE